MVFTRFAHVAVISLISACWWHLASAARPNERSSSGEAATSSVQLLAHGHMVSRGRPIVNESLDLLHALEGHGRHLQSLMGDSLAADDQRERDRELAAERKAQLTLLESRKPELANKAQKQLVRTNFKLTPAAPESLTQQDRDIAREEENEEDQVRKMISKEEVYAMVDDEDHHEDLKKHVAEIRKLMDDPSNLIAADDSMLTKLPPQYQDIQKKFSKANHNVWKDGENGGENFIRDTGNSWITEAQKFQTGVKELHSHADEVYADMVHDHEVAAEKQMTSFKTEIAKLNPVFDKHEQIAAEADGHLFARAPPVRSDDSALVSISQDQEDIRREISRRNAAGE